MPEARHEVTIRRPTSEVFGFIADAQRAEVADRHPRYRPGLRNRGRATYKQGVNGPGGRRIDADYRVTVL